MKLATSLPGDLSISASSGGIFSSVGFRYNYAFGTLPFLSAASREHPIVRETAPIRKEQFDSARTPGEQSLTGWWLRSQQSFHGGAGLLFGDPTDSEAVALTRYRSSINVNPWVQGEVSLLNAVKDAHSSAVAATVDATEFQYLDGTSAAMYVGGSTINVVLAASSVQTSFAAVTAEALQSVTTDGEYMYVVTADGVYAAAIPATSATAFTWAKEYTVTTPPDLSCHLSFVKHRLMLGAGKSIYELAPHPGGAPAALPAAKYEYAADDSWHWTSFAESAQAIYACGNNGIRSAVVKFTLATDGTIPTLTGGAVALQLPSGEVAYSVFGYLGVYVGIGTNKGARVAVANDSGDLNYGPVLFTSAQPITGWSARDRFLWCGVTEGHDGASGLYRIDLSNQVEDLRFAFATDVYDATDTSSCGVVAHLGDTDLITYGTSANVYVEDAANLAETGYIQTARIRYGTLEPKLFKLLRVRGPVQVGPLSFAILDQNDAVGGSFLFPEGDAPGASDITISSPDTPQDFISLKFTLGRDDVTPTNGGSLTGYQLKALPATERRRIVQLPLLCFDRETDATGMSRGYVGSALERLYALEALEAAGNSMLWQDLDTGINTPVVIEQVRFEQTSPPHLADGFGGVITLTLRTI